MGSASPGCAAMNWICATPTVLCEPGLGLVMTGDGGALSVVSEAGGLRLVMPLALVATTTHENDVPCASTPVQLRPADEQISRPFASTSYVTL
jgi:hypothetical protein